MSHKFISKTLAIVSAFALILGTFETIPAQAQTNVSLPACFISGAGGTVANVSIPVGDLCLDGGKVKKLFRECKGSEATSSFDFSRCIKNASKEEVAARFVVASGTVNVCPNAGTGSCAAVDVGAGANTGGNTGGRTNVNGTGGNTNGTVNAGSTRTGGGSTRTGTRTGDARVDAQTDLDILARHCGDNGDLNGYDATRSTDLENIVEQLKNYAPNCSGADCVNLGALKTAMNTALNACHNQCVHIALDKDNACFWKNITGAGKFQNENEFCQVLTSTDSDSRVNDFLAAYPGSQNDCKTLIGRNTDQGAVCRAMVGDANCSQVMRSDAFGCDGFRSAADAYYTALNNYNNLIADQRTLNGPSDSRKCKIASASDATRAFDGRDTVSIKCLIDMQASCVTALENAQTRYETVVANQRTWCPTCNQNQQSTTCMYGGTCTGGVSKTAQVLNGIANIGGQIITPLGLGLMNMSMNNKSLAACTSIAAQQIDLYKNVGLTGPVNSCGTGGFGMSGFGGLMGMGGSGGYNPYGALGMGGMGMGGMGMGGMGYNPYGAMGGMGMGLGMGGMGMGNGLGLGLNMGLGLGMGNGMGMGGMGYNPYGGMNQYGMGLGGGMPQLGLGIGMGTGMPGMSPYNPYGGMSQYGLGIGGLGTGMNPGLYQNNMYQSQANMGSVMQQMQMQNQLINASAYQSNPFMGQMGMSQYNPYAMYGGYGGNGLGFSAGINIGLPSISAGIGTYNPYSAYGYQGSSCGFYTAGVPCSGY